MALRRMLAGLVAVVALLGAAGCTTTGPNVAAVVGSTVITQNQVEQASAGMTQIVGSDPNYTGTNITGFILNSLIRKEVLTTGLATLGVSFTDEQRDQYWNSAMTADTADYALRTDPRTRDAMAGFVDVQLVNAQLSDGTLNYDAVLAATAAVPVEVNPRYGTWDATQLVVTSLADGKPAGPLAVPTAFTAPA